MLITLYQNRNGRWYQIDQYYRWRVELAEEIKEQLSLQGIRGHRRLMSTACPGCGRVLLRTLINAGHHCPGTLTDQPVQPRRGRFNFSAAEADAVIQDYVRHSDPATQMIVE